MDENLEAFGDIKMTTIKYPREAYMEIMEKSVLYDLMKKRQLKKEKHEEMK